MSFGSKSISSSFISAAKVKIALSSAAFLSRSSMRLRMRPWTSSVVIGHVREAHRLGQPCGTDYAGRAMAVLLDAQDCLCLIRRVVVHTGAVEGDDLVRFLLDFGRVGDIAHAGLFVIAGINVASDLSQCDDRDIQIAGKVLQAANYLAYPLMLRRSLVGVTGLDALDVIDQQDLDAVLLLPFTGHACN